MFVFVAASRRWHSLNNESRCVFCNRVCIRGNMFPFSPRGRFRPSPVIVRELITLKARLPGDISQRCLPARRHMKGPHVLPSEGEAITESHKSNQR